MFQIMAETQQEGEARWGRYSGCYRVKKKKKIRWGHGNDRYRISMCYCSDREGWSKKTQRGLKRDTNVLK